MRRYIVRRLFIVLPTLLVVTVVPVGLRELVDEECLLAWILCGGDIFGEEAMAEFKDSLGIGLSFPERYAEWVGGALRGDLGASWWTGRDSLDMIAGPSRISIALVLIALAVAFTAATAHGMVAAVRPGSRLDRWSVSIFRIGAGTPEFIMAILGAFVLYALLGWTLTDHIFRGAPDWPVAALVVGGVAAGWYVGAGTALRTSSARRDAPDGAYVTTARAKGFSDPTIATRHVLRNATTTALRAAAHRLPVLLGSVLMVEVALGLPGVGLLALEGVFSRDYPVVQGVLFVSAVTVIGVNLAVDVACAALDPRIRNATSDTRGDARPGCTL